MKINMHPVMKALVLACLSFSATISAFAQHELPLVMHQPAPLVLTQSLEPSLKVHPNPKLGIETPIVGGQCICTAQYDPVCARTRDGSQTTYSNACKAQCARATVIARGKC